MKGASRSCICLQATEVKVNDVDFNPEFVAKMIPKLEWSALVQAAEEVTSVMTVWLSRSAFNYSDK